MTETLEAVKEKLRGMGKGTAPQILKAMNGDYPSSPYNLEEIEGQLEIIVAKEPSEFYKVGDEYRSSKSYRVRQN